MIRIFLNGLAASAGAGLTYLYNVVPHFSALPEVRTTLAIQPNLRQNFEQFSNVDVLCPAGVSDAGRRFIFEQWKLPDLIRRSRADVLISAGNFALRNSPVPQILLSGNSLYTSGDFCRDLRSRREYAMLLDNSVKGALAKKSVQWADQTVAPSQAFADELRRWTGREVNAIYHGFDHEAFFSGTALPADVQEKVDETKDCLRLLFVSHYNYYRNFETLLRAVPFIQKLAPGRKVKLFLTCKLELGANPGSYDGRQARGMVRDLGISESVVELGAVPYGSLHHVYRACDLYVTTAYAETFAHPLVEAMASGLPVVASDLPVHREVCGDAARYFPRFSAKALAEIVAAVLDSEMRSKLTLAGKDRVTHFSWFKHVGSLLQIVKALCENGQASSARCSRLPSVNCVSYARPSELTSNAASIRS